MLDMGRDPYKNVGIAQLASYGTQKAAFLAAFIPPDSNYQRVSAPSQPARAIVRASWQNVSAVTGSLERLALTMAHLVAKTLGS